MQTTEIDMVKQITPTEYKILDSAVSELLKDGKITLKCPRCGKSLVYEERGSMEIIRCEDLSCVKSIRRGI